MPRFLKRLLPFFFAIAVTALLLYLNERELAQLPQTLLGVRPISWLKPRVHASYFGLTLAAWVIALGWYFNLPDDE